MSATPDRRDPTPREKCRQCNMHDAALRVSKPTKILGALCSKCWDASSHSLIGHGYSAAWMLPPIPEE